jgi:peroxiredoxin
MSRYLAALTLLVATTQQGLALDNVQRYLFGEDMSRTVSEYAADITLMNLKLELFEDSGASEVAIGAAREKNQVAIMRLNEKFFQKISAESRDLTKDLDRIYSKARTLTRRVEEAKGDAKDAAARDLDAVEAEIQGRIRAKEIIVGYKSYKSSTSLIDGSPLPEKRIGSQAPDFTLSSTKGNQQSLNAVSRNTVTVLVFMSYEHKDSIEMFTALAKAVAKYKDVAVVGIDVGHTVHEWVEQALPVGDHLVLFDTTGDTANAYQVGYLPQVVIMDKTRKVRAVFVGATAQARRNAVTAVEELHESLTDDR